MTPYSADQRTSPLASHAYASQTPTTRSQLLFDNFPIFVYEKAVIAANMTTAIAFAHRYVLLALYLVILVLLLDFVEFRALHKIGMLEREELRWDGRTSQHCHTLISGIFET